MLRKLTESGQGAANGGSIIAGTNVLSSPVQLFLVQIVVIVMVTRALGMLFTKYLRQPRVIAEIIGGILLGPTALGQIPGFQEGLFPKESLESLKLVSELGLLLFLFIVGLELDVGVMRANAPRAFTISITGQALSWGLSIIASYLMYQYSPGVKENGSYFSFLLFIGVAFASTAFPVLSRILTENKLLATAVGIAAISAAAFDDIAAWCLLALTISITNAGSPLQALWVFLLLAAYALFMLLVFRRFFAKVCHNMTRGGTEVGDLVVFVCLVMALISGWWTACIGVDPIFGAFIGGLVVPRTHDLAIIITEKIEDVITVLLLPLYFAYSGLATDLTQLTESQDWGFVVLVVVLACAGKIIGATAASKLIGMPRREAITMGFLMNTRGLIEIVILNIGLNAGVITSRVFAIMVLMALVTTCMTSPIVRAVYPREKHRALSAVKGVSTDEQATPGEGFANAADVRKAVEGLRLVVAVPGIKGAQAVLKVVHMLQESAGRSVKAGGVSKSPALGKTESSEGHLAEVHAVRILQLPEGRFSSDMRAADVKRTLKGDEVAEMLKVYARLHNMSVQLHLATAPNGYDYHQDPPGEGLVAGDIIDIVEQDKLDTLLIPWEPKMVRRGQDVANGVEEHDFSHMQSSAHHRVVTDVLLSCPCRVGVLVERGIATVGPPLQQTAILVPFFGGPDDQEAVVMALALARPPLVAVHVLWVRLAAQGGPVRSVFPSAAGPLPRRQSSGLDSDSLSELNNTNGSTGLRALLETFGDLKEDYDDPQSVRGRMTILPNGAQAQPQGATPIDSKSADAVSEEERFLRVLDSMGVADITEQTVVSMRPEDAFTPVQSLLTTASDRYSLVVLGHAGTHFMHEQPAGMAPDPLLPLVKSPSVDLKGSSVAEAPEVPSGPGPGRGQFVLSNHQTLPLPRRQSVPAAEPSVAAMPLSSQTSHAPRRQSHAATNAGTVPRHSMYNSQHTWSKLFGASLHPSHKPDQKSAAILGNLGNLLVRSFPSTSLLVVRKSAWTSKVLMRTGNDNQV